MLILQNYLRLRCESPLSINSGNRRWRARPLVVIAIDWRPSLRSSFKLAALNISFYSKTADFTSTDELSDALANSGLSARQSDLGDPAFHEESRESNNFII